VRHSRSFDVDTHVLRRIARRLMCASQVQRWTSLAVALLPDSAIARGGVGGANDGAILLGLAMLALLAWLGSRATGATWRAFGGLLLGISALAFVVQLVRAIA
jgi:hypothetical protein